MWTLDTADGSERPKPKPVAQLPPAEILGRYWYFHTGTVSRRKPTNPPLSKPPTKFPKTQLPSPAPINSPPTFPPMKWVTLPPVEPTKFLTPLPSSKPPTSRQPTNYPVGKPTNPPTKFPTPLPSSKPPTSQPTSVGDLLVSGAVDQQQLVTPPSNNNENSNNNNINTQEEGGGATTSWEQSNDPDSLCTHNNSIKLTGYKATLDCRGYVYCLFNCLLLHRPNSLPSNPTANVRAGSTTSSTSVETRNASSTNTIQ